MSFLVTRPANPVPGMALISTLCSAAIFRTSGVDLRRSRSSTLSAAPFPPVASPTARDSGIDPLAAAAGTERGAGGAGVAPEVPGGLDGAGASGAAGEVAGGADLGVTGAAGGGAAGAGAAGFSPATAPASV